VRKKQGPSFLHAKYLPNTGLVFSTNDKNFTANFNFFGQMAFLSATGSKQLKKGFVLPDAEIDLSGTLYKHWTYLLTYKLDNRTIDDATLGYQTGNTDIDVGETGAYFGLANDAADPAATFLNAPMPALAFSPPNGQGVFFDTAIKNFGLQFSVFGQSIHTHSKGSSPIAETARVVYSPVHKNGNVWHFGLSLWQQTVNGQHQASFSAAPEVQTPNQATLVNTGTINNVSNYTEADLEFARVSGPWSVQSEYMQAWVRRQHNLSSLAFNGYYLTASYFLTGESRTYSFPLGLFSGITPIRHSYGAWQVAARASHINLSDGDVRGGKETNYTLGLNWYPTHYLEIMTNYIRAIATPDSNGNSQRANIYAIQFQASF
jgi:phosphate-selective porin OprO/OprP